METTKFSPGSNSFAAAKAVEIENGVTEYTFNTEAETEAAAMFCIENGLKFNTTGRRALVIHQPAPAMANEATDATTTETETAPANWRDSHAAFCLHLYLNNTAEIYDRFTIPAIKRLVRAYKAREMVCADPEHFEKNAQEVTPAIQSAARLVQKYDHITPTPADIEAVKADYVAYIIECAQYEVNDSINA